jgi:hypothetical protein
MTGKKITARIYIPADMTSSGAVFIQSGGWVWERGDMINFTSGAWNELTLDVDHPPAQSVSGVPDHTNVQRLGIAFMPNAPYTGSVYYDSIDVVVAGTPTSTATKTPTFTISPTASSTRTPGGPSDTITPTFTVTPTITPSYTAISTPISPSDPSIQYFGRWNLSTPSDPRNGWGTTYIVAGFSGTSVSINISAWDSWYAYGIDDFSDHTTFKKFRVKNQFDFNSAVATQTPLVITGLSDTNHTIMIVRRTEGTGGVNDFFGFGLDTGKTLFSPGAKTTKKMEIIGDSITCGSATEYNAAVPTAVADLPCLYGGCIQNGDMSFGMQLARMYGAEGRTISRGGIGIYRNCNNCTPNYQMPAVYPNMYFEQAPSGSSLTWNFSSWQADVVIVALGTNDFDPTLSPSSPDPAAFKAAYSDFLTSLRTYYQNAYILCTEPLPSWVSSNAGVYISAVVAAKADAKIKYIAVNNPPIAAGFPLQANEYAGDNTHPLVASHTKFANALKAWIDANIYPDLAANYGW